ncbi:MAG: hypothetical protein Q8R47_02425 [Nanoarchaeota archaeon]|nr:hypothetical protein [Nanoarchaeota archaeon]
MVEKNLLINNKKIVYHGVFRTSELLSVIHHAIEERGYGKSEKKNEELVTPEGRLLQLELRPSKSVSPYLQLMIKIRITLDTITETMKEVSGVKQKYQQGDVLIAFDAWSITNHEGRWGLKPFSYFMRSVIHKYIYKFRIEEDFLRQLVGDTAYIYGQVKNLLQSYEGKKIAPLKEAEIMRKVEEEMRKESSAEM